MLKQVSVYAENKKGALKIVTGILTDADINILGSVTNDSAEYGIIRMVVTDPEKAQKILTEAGYLCRLTNVLGIEVEDEVGSLNRVLAAFLESNINVNYQYLSFNRQSGKPVMVLYTDDCEFVEKCLAAKGFQMTEV